MKKILILLFALNIAYSSKGTHLMGGQIIATYLSSDSSGVHYALDFTAYRDTIGIPISANATFQIEKLDTSGNWNFLFSSTVNFDTTSGNLLPNVTVYGVEVYSYLDTITLPGNGYYAISWDDCCRNVSIINMSNPGGESLALSTYLKVDSLNINSSPIYLTPPVAYLPVDTVWQYNPLPFDPDGDSLVWSMVTPLDDNGVVSGYQFLSDSMYSDTLGVFSLDSITGSLSWDPAMIGNFVASFIIEEYRNGIKMGEVRRDMQFIVIADTVNTMPQISNMQSIPTNTGGYPFVKINPGINYNLQLLGNDADSNDVLKMEAYGEVFSLSGSPANFNFLSTGNGNEIEGNFSWTPSLNHVRSLPYITVFRTTDGMFYYDNTIQFEVTQNINTNTVNFESIQVDNIYPNPASNQFIISLDSDKSETIFVQIYNVLGEKVYNKEVGIFSGKNILFNNLNLKSGQYFLNILQHDRKQIISKKLIVIK